MKRICAVLAAVLLLPTLAHARAYSGGGAGSVYGLPGLVARYDASVSSSITIATGVSQWNDLSGAGNHLKQGTGAAQPTVSSGGILFNGTSQFLKATAFTLNQPETVYLVGQQVTWTVNRAVYDGNAANSMQLVQTVTTPNITVFAGGGGNGNTGWVIATNAVITGLFNGASSATRVNQGAALTDNAGANNAGGFTLGAIGNSTGFTNILVFEVIIYSGAHSTAQQTAIISFLEAKWGLPQI
jgi:hypothetical protein